MKQPSVPVGIATKAGLGVSALSFAAAIFAYATGDHSQQALGAITASGVGTVSLLATLAGRFIQSNTILRRGEQIAGTVLTSVEHVDPGIVTQLEGFITGELAKVHAHLDTVREWLPSDEQEAAAPPPVTGLTVTNPPPRAADRRRHEPPDAGAADRRRHEPPDAGAADRRRHEPPDDVPRFGLDYLAPLPVSEVLATGASFVCRYTTTLTANEAKALSDAGLDLVLLHETNPDAIAGGADAGELAAHQAVAAAIRCGMVGGRPIVFAPADLDVSGNPSVLGPFFDGCARVLPLSRIWGYQGFAGIGWLFDNHKISGALQTAAWSRGQWDPRAQIRQDSFLANWDGDNAYAADFGQWRYGVKPPPPPVTVKLRGKAIDVSALEPAELKAARTYTRDADVHPHWHPHHTQAALAELVRMRRVVWTAAVKGIAGGKRVTPGWDHQDRRQRYHQLSALTDWPPKH